MFLRRNNTPFGVKNGYWQSLNSQVERIQLGKKLSKDEVLLSEDMNADPRYLRGVIDALELVASFVEWKSQHPESPRTAKEFIQEAITKMESRTKRSQLDSLLGLKVEE